MQMEKTSSRRRKALQLGTVVGVTAAAVLAPASPSWAAADTAVVSPSSGPVSTAVQVSLSVATQSTAANSFIPGSTYVTFDSGNSCPTTQVGTAEVAAVAAGSVTVISPTRLTFATPATLTAANGGGTGTNDFSVCAYNGAGGPLLAGANLGYHVGALPTITGWSPKAAATRGGGTIIITGTNLDSATISIGDDALSPTVNGAGTIATAAIPAHGAGTFPLVVTKTEGGIAVAANAFTYSNGVVVTPNNGSNTRTRTDVSVAGSNLSGITFGTTTGATPDDSNGHVFLAKGVYDPAKSGLVKANPQVTECLNVLPISNTELVCSLYLSGGGGVPSNSSRTVSATVSGTQLTAAAGNFGPGDVGLTVSGATSLGANTYITGVIDPTKVTLNKAPSAAITTAANLTLAPARTFTDAVLANNSNVITSAAGAQFSPVDVGRTIAGTSLSGITIASVTSPTTAVLSGNATGAATGTYTITGSKAPLPEVPIGTYTVTVVNNGSLDAQATMGFSRSVVSSGSTFTVAEY